MATTTSPAGIYIVGFRINMVAKEQIIKIDLSKMGVHPGLEGMCSAEAAPIKPINARIAPNGVCEDHMTNSG